MTNETPWFVAQLRPHGLKTASAHLHRQGFETFAPMQNTSAVRAGLTTQATRALFPGYLFIGFDPSKTTWSVINNTRGVSRLVLADPLKPVPLPAELMAGLMARCDATGVLLPPENLDVGDKVRVLAGPFADTITTIETLPDQARIGVLLELLGRKVKTTLPRDGIEKIS